MSAVISAELLIRTTAPSEKAKAVVPCVKVVSSGGQVPDDLTMVKVSDDLFVTLTISLFVTAQDVYSSIVKKYG
jgi:hypothetical protein